MNTNPKAQAALEARRAEAEALRAWDEADRAMEEATRAWREAERALAETRRAFHETLRAWDEADRARRRALAALTPEERAEYERAEYERVKEEQAAAFAPNAMGEDDPGKFGELLEANGISATNSPTPTAGEIARIAELEEALRELSLAEFHANDAAARGYLRRAAEQRRATAWGRARALLAKENR